MPELPEVQTTVNGLNRTIVGLKVKDVWTDYDSPFYYGRDNIKDPKYFRWFKKQIIDRKVTGVSRRAKNILIELDNGKIILVHMKMTGHLLFGKYKKVSSKISSRSFDARKNLWPVWKPVSPVGLKDPFNRFIHFVITFMNGKHLALCDMRKFGTVSLLERRGTSNTLSLENGGDKEVAHLFKEHIHFVDLGPEPLSANMNGTIFYNRIHQRPDKPIKALLIDQTIIAGVGNIYADEALWYASIHPMRASKKIDKREASKLFRILQKILVESIDTGGSSTSDYRNIHGDKGASQENHRAYRMHGKKCTKKGCDGIIKRIVVATRGTHFCDKHQK